MPYNDDTAWTDWVRLAEQNGKALMQQIRDSKARGYDEWQSFRAGRTNAQIATALGRAESEIAEMDSAFSAFLHVENYLTNNSPATGQDHAYNLRVFT